MITSFKKNLNHIEQINTMLKCMRLALLIMLITFCFSGLYAANYDFNKLSSLATLRYGQEAYKNVSELNQLIINLKSASEIEKLKQINNFFNQKIRFTDDQELWDQVDYWATPLETIGKQAGDCEDFSIAKYIFLKVLNIPNEKLRLTYVRAEIFTGDLRSIRAHMVLSYYNKPQSEPLILDNLNFEIMPASQRKDLTPIFSFNSKGLWVGSSINPKGDAVSHLSKWRDVLSRIQADGIE